MLGFTKVAFKTVREDGVVSFWMDSNLAADWVINYGPEMIDFAKVRTVWVNSEDELLDLE